MGIAQSFNKAISNQLKAYAAWVPVVNTFKIGDYGIFSDGIFQSLGNLKDKYPEINLVTGVGTTADIDFSSSGTRKFILDANGNTAESFGGMGNANATIKLVFDSADSSLIKASLSVQQLQNIDVVATILANKSDWRRKFSVVSKVYTGEKCVVICTKEAGTTVEIKAGADILKQVDAGKVEVGVQFTSSRDSTFKAIGETGALALGLFKLNIFDNVKVLTMAKGEHFKIDELKGEEMPDDF